MNDTGGKILNASKSRKLPSSRRAARKFSNRCSRSPPNPESQTSVAQPDNAVAMQNAISKGPKAVSWLNLISSANVTKAMTRIGRTARRKGRLSRLCRLQGLATRWAMTQGSRHLPQASVNRKQLRHDSWQRQARNRCMARKRGLWDSPSVGDQVPATPSLRRTSSCPDLSASALSPGTQSLLSMDC